MKKLMLRTKFMSFSVGMVVLLMILSSVIISIVIYRQNKNVSEKFLSQAISLLKEETALIENRLRINSKQMLSGGDIGGSIKYIQSFAGTASMKSSMDRASKEMAQTIYTIGLTGNIWKTLIYANDGTLMAFSVIEDQKAILGFARLSDFSIVDMNSGDSLENANWTDTTSFDLIGRKYEGEIPAEEKILFMKSGENISLVSFLPVKALVYDEKVDNMVDKQVGFIMSVSKFDDQFATRLSGLTHTNINVFSGNTVTVGTLATYKTLNMNGVGDIENNNRKSDAVLFNEVTVDKQGYFQAIVPIYAGTENIGAFVSLYSTAEAMSNTWTIVRMLVIISIIFIILIIPLSIVFARGMTSPLNDLSRTLVDVAESADFSKRINVKSEDEVGLTGIAFNSLMDALQTTIGSINEAMSAVAEGNLTKSIDGEYKGELAVLQSNINHSIEILHDTIGQVLISFDQVANGANELSNSSKSLAQGTTQQAATLEEISSAMNEISVQAKTNNDDANNASQITGKAIENGKNGKTQMENMLASMKEINETSNEVSKIIKVIDDIAFQTNLLALNAAVEAARAGKYGKGFAVVAEEVRNLAARSAEAAKNTTGLIENSLKQVELGVQNADKTSEILFEIAGSIDQSNDLVGKIAAASKEQDSGVTEINDGLSQVNNVIQQNSAIAEESSAASDELMSQARMVKETLNRFQLKNTAYATGFQEAYEEDEDDDDYAEYDESRGIPELT